MSNDSPTIVHIVFFRIPAQAETNPQQVAEKLRSLEGNVPQILAIDVGIDINRSERAWDVSLYTEFANPQTLAQYQNHPFHQDVVAWLRSHEIVTSVVDYARP